MTLRTARRIALFLLLSAAFTAIHGYHPATEDDEVYLPAIKKNLDPALYPVNAFYFDRQMRVTLYDETLATLARFSHLNLNLVLLIVYLTTGAALLAGCHRLTSNLFDSQAAGWWSVAVLGVFFTLPVGGSALYIVDPYLHPREITTAFLLWTFVFANASRWSAAALCWTASALFHPLMALFGLSLTAAWILIPASARVSSSPRALAFALLGVDLSPSWWEAAGYRPYYFLEKWHWYEWLGALAPVAIFLFYCRWARLRGLERLQRWCAALVLFSLAHLALSLLTLVPSLRFFAVYQPMRWMHLAFLFLLLLTAGCVSRQTRNLRTAAALCLLVAAPTMFLVQRGLYASSEHLELPGRSSGNPWVQAFLWVRANTPGDAVFALDPRYLAAPGNDSHGFRALAERSLFADALKDAGAATVFPDLAPQWTADVNALAAWPQLSADTVAALRSRGVSWVVVAASQAGDSTVPIGIPL